MLKIGDKTKLVAFSCYMKIQNGSVLSSNQNRVNGQHDELTVIAVGCKIPCPGYGDVINDTIVVNNDNEVFFMRESHLADTDPRAAERENARKKLQEIEDTARELRQEFNL